MKAAEILRKPEWLKVRLPNSSEFKQVKGIVEGYGLHTVCREARCPNMTECFHAGTATFLILGDICTRNCRYCHVRHGMPEPPDAGEPERLVRAAKALGLKYAVVTSVTRDDLADGGAEIFARTIELFREELPGCGIEVLIPDFQGNEAALNRIAAARPDVINHNIEVVRSLFPSLRPQGSYTRSLELLRRVHEAGIESKSGLMIGFGELHEEILETLRDLRTVDCRSLTVGQYQQPSFDRVPVRKYYTPAEFDRIGEAALDLGFRSVQSGPLVRSSYRAADFFSGSPDSKKTLACAAGTER
jgi:lipoic acid synthetase